MASSITGLLLPPCLGSRVFHPESAQDSGTEQQSTPKNRQACLKKNYMALSRTEHCSTFGTTAARHVCGYCLGSRAPAHGPALTQLGLCTQPIHPTDAHGIASRPVTLGKEMPLAQDPDTPKHRS